MPRTNKKTIQELEARRVIYLRRATRALAELNKIEVTIKKIRSGKLKQPEPEGKLVKFGKAQSITAAEFGDLVPTFGTNK